MQEIKKRRILLASILKPVNDPRMFEKMGQSLSRQYEVHIIGTNGIVDSANASIFFHPLSAYSRFSLNRLLAPAKVLKKIFQLRPALVVLCTHELLWTVLIAKVFLRCHIIYDVRENYFRNILYTRAFPAILRIFIALYVRIKEWITAPFVDLFFLAEAGYARELGFPGNNKIVIENKVKKIDLPVLKKWSADDGNFHLIFTGTLAFSTGVFVAIDLVSKLHAQDPDIRLHIIGFSAMAAVQHQIKDVIRDKPFISFEVTSEPVPHFEILKAVQQADAGIIAYPPNVSTENTIPTKLFEYLGYTLPIVLIDHKPWVARCQPYPAAIPFDMKAPGLGPILQALRHGIFYTTRPTDVFWETEEQTLLEAVSTVLN